MKHLLSINELLKSTYLSASDRLGRKHNKRSSDLIDYASEKGEDNKQDRIYPHKFIFDDSLKNEYFFITSIEHKEYRNNASTILEINFKMKSNWNRYKKIDLDFHIMRPGTHYVEENTLEYYNGHIFKNEDTSIARKNARHLLKCFKEYCEDYLMNKSKDGFGEFVDYKVVGPNINDLYETP